LIRARILVEGVVQRVGYRDFVQELARVLGVKGYVENLKDGNVQIVCEAEEKVLEGFVREINVKGDFIEVERVQLVERSEATGEFEYFEIKYGVLEEELGERMGTAVKYAGAIRQDIKEMHKDLKEDTTGIKGAIVEMHKDLKGDTTAIKEGIREMHKDLRDEVVDMHVDVNKSFEEMAKRYDVISAELVRTREELTRAVNGLLRLIQKLVEEKSA
jgi:acylphosphatase